MPTYSFEQTCLWTSTLAPQPEPDPHSDKRDLLRSTFFLFRERAEHIAAEIARDLPDFTVHDVTHLDALWEMAALAAGPSFVLTPTEAFVLGGAFLIHDLGMGLAAYPEGKMALQRDKSWPDTVAALLRRKLGRIPTPEEIEAPPPEIESAAIGEVLRAIHARRAASLALTHWHDLKHQTNYHLIESPELRERFGTTIGNIAFSHWWAVSELRDKFNIKLGAPGGWPNDWTVDQLKLACLLRIADASHIDARRAPAFLRALRKPRGIADAHWAFQQKLNQPRLEDDRLEYTSGSPFRIDEADAWWVCRDTLEMIDGELRRVDSLLADTNRQRLKARAIAGIDDPLRLTKFIPTDGWKPADTRVRVTDVPALIERLGGKELYGNDPTVPLRELIQNASDAVRARRLFNGSPGDWGEIVVRLGSDASGFWLEVEDNGIGMSSQVMAGPLLDFGASYWGSALMREETPNLWAKGFKPTGRYGIGFFSVFMWGQHVRVTSRRADEAPRDTRILEFSTGLAARPFLRSAAEHEWLLEGGTKVRVWLKTPPEESGGLLWKHGKSWRLGRLCEWLCPALDVNLSIDEGGTVRRVISASDWLTLDGKTLLRRIHEPNRAFRVQFGNQSPAKPIDASTIRPLRDSAGSIVGRACVAPCGFNDGNRGVVTVGGLRAAELSGIAGILIGEPLTAARNVAKPIVSGRVLRKWASRQARLVEARDYDIAQKLSAADIIRACGGDTGSLPIARTKAGWIAIGDVAGWRAYDEVLLVQDAAVGNIEEYGRMVIKLHDNVIVVDMGTPGILQNGTMGFAFRVGWPPRPPSSSRKLRRSVMRQSLEGLVVEALANAWSASVDSVLSASEWSSGDIEIKREIGRSNNTPIIEDVDIVRNPLAAHRPTHIGPSAKTVAAPNRGAKGPGTSSRPEGVAPAMNKRGSSLSAAKAKKPRHGS